MGIVYLILLGLVAGAIARFIMPGRQSMGIIMTILLGIAGSFAGGFLSSVINKAPVMEFHQSNLIWSVVGALILLLAYSMLQKRT